MDAHIREIATENLLATIGLPFVAVVEKDGEWWVLQHSESGVFPQSRHPSARLAVARVMQLLHVGPVAPQTHPETACIEIAS